VQNSYDLRGDHGPSGFDARHHFVARAIYNLPFRGSGFVEGWQFAIILQAQSGNVLVWEPSLGRLSNAYPITILQCPEPTSFCTASPNSFSPTGAILDHSGSTSVTLNNFVLEEVGGVPPNKTCAAFYGQNTSINVTYGDGRRCIASPFFRLHPATTSNVFGDFSMPVDLGSLSPAGSINAGQTWGWQVMYRDPAAGGSGFNITNGLLTHWCP